MARRTAAARLNDVAIVLRDSAAKGRMDLALYERLYAAEPSIAFNMARNIAATNDESQGGFGTKLSDRESKLRAIAKSGKLTAKMVLGAI